MENEPFGLTWGAWSSQIVDYTIECKVTETVRDTFSVIVLENKKEIERVDVVCTGRHDWQKPHDVAERLRLKYHPRFMAEYRLRAGGI